MKFNFIEILIVSTILLIFIAVYITNRNTNKICDSMLQVASNPRDSIEAIKTCAYLKRAGRY